MNTALDYTIEKLIVLFIAETVESPMQNNTLTEICAYNEWVPYMSCKECIVDLIDAKFLVNVSKNNTPHYVISSEGSECLSYFYHKIPMSKRDAIKKHINENLSLYRRKQEYVSSYHQNADGSYTVTLKITSSSANPLMEMRLSVQNRNTAKWIHKQWVEKAPDVYESIYEHLLV